MNDNVKMFSIEELEEGDPVQFVGVHILRWERMMKEYSIPMWDYAFLLERDDPRTPPRDRIKKCPECDASSYTVRVSDSGTVWCRCNNCELNWRLDD